MFKVACLAYKVLHGLASAYLANLLQWYIPARSLHSADKDLLVIPKIRTKKYGSQTFAHAAPSVFNALPQDVRQSPSLESFKAWLKTQLFIYAFNQ